MPLQGVGARIETDPDDPDPEASHRPMAHESGRPMSVIAFRTSHAEQHLGFLPSRSTGSKAIPDDRLVPEEGVLAPGLLMVARGLLPPSPSDGLYLLDGAITRAGPRSASGHRCGLGRRNHDGRAPCTGCIVEGDRVVGRVRGDAGDVAVDRPDQRDGRRRIVDRRLGQRLGDDDTKLVDAHVKLSPAPLATSSMFRCGPFAFAPDRESRAVDDQMEASVRRDSSTREVEALASA